MAHLLAGVFGGFAAFKGTYNTEVGRRAATMTTNTACNPQNLPLQIGGGAAA